MLITTKTEEDFVSELQKRFKLCQFCSLLYRTKQYFNKTGDLIEGGELSRYLILLGTNYINLLEKSLLELEIQFSEKTFKTPLQILAATEVLESLRESLAKHKIGLTHHAYTKKGLYLNIIQGLNINKNDSSFQLFGIKLKQTILEPGKHQIVLSSARVIQKNLIKETLAISQFREFSLEKDCIVNAKISGQTIILGE